MIAKFFLLEGHRRYKAVELAVSQGKLDAKTFRFPMVKSRPLSDIDRALGLVTYNSGKPLHMLEEAVPYQRAFDYGATIPEIAKRVGKSEQHIKNCFSLLTASVYTKKLIQDDKVTATTIVAMLKKKEPIAVEQELKEAINKKVSSAIENNEISFNGEVTEFSRMEDNVKTTGASGKDLAGDSGVAIRLTAKNLSIAKPKKYSKEFILGMLHENGYKGEPVWDLINSALI